MKSRMRKNKRPAVPVKDDRASNEDVLAVIADIDSGREYYMSYIDMFQLRGKDYVVMYNYEPDDGSHREPEIVIMRSERHVTGEQFFKSILNKKELDAAFNMFYSRFAHREA